MRIRKFSAFVFILLVMSASAVWADDVKVDEDTFPDKIFRRYISEKIDVGGTGEAGVEAGDGKLSPGEISRVLTMDLSAYNRYMGGGIEDLTGIKIFTALQTLQCGYHKLTALNVSKMTSLSKLYCQGNDLKTLNVEGCTALSVLQCNNNELSGTLDLSELKSLQDLYCQYNEDLSVVLPKRAEGKIGLENVNCNYTKSAGPLTSEVLTPQLKSLQLEGQTSITELDLSYAQYLSRLNVSGDSNLTTIKWDMTTQGMTFYGLDEVNISGTHLDVNGTLNILTERSFDPSEFRAAYMVGGISKIDISKMTRLQYLDLRGNGLTEITMPESTSQSYSYFYLESNDLTYMPSIPDGVTYVYVSNNKITSLGGAVSNTSSIPNVKGTSYTIPVSVTQLYADNNQITNANLSHLVGLQEIHLSNNLLTNDGLVLPGELSELSSW
ncbi:MAG: hypothetical protein IJS42_06330, partial [Synergistaceae bacterium]|nr:hypothetical protein [Synergistaceae bacterium]